MGIHLVDRTIGSSTSPNVSDTCRTVGHQEVDPPAFQGSKTRRWFEPSNPLPIDSEPMCCRICTTQVEKRQTRFGLSRLSRGSDLRGRQNHGGEVVR